MEIIPILIFNIFTITCGALTPQSDVGLSPIGMIRNHGYPSETHYITTEDGYILTCHRIPSATPKPSIFLVHGMFSSSADYVNSGPNSLGYFLSDSGYDVWLGNARGNAFSRNHTTLDPKRDKKHFYNFSWHEIGYYDLPAIIDYILKLKNEDRLYYVGHSQGTTSFLVMASTRPEYNKKIKVAHLLAPSAILANCPSKLLVDASQKIDSLAQVVKKLGMYEVPLTDVLRSIGPRFCSHQNYHYFCGILFTVLINSEKFDMNLLPTLLTNFPSNIASNQAIHYGQLIKSGRFQKFDYGVKKNLKIYGTEVPPLYEISKITAPVACYYATSDNLLSPKDVQVLINQLPNIVLDYLVARKTFNHFDFLFATDVVTLVYNQLLETNKKY